MTIRRADPEPRTEDVPWPVLCPSMGRVRSTDDTEHTVWRNFLQAHARVTARLDTDLVNECDMTLAEFEVLDHLAEAADHRLRMNELADRARLSPSGLTRRFDALVRRGWAARDRCDQDRRGVLARLTPEGLEQVERARPVHDRGERVYFGDVLGQDEMTALGDAVARLADANDPATATRARVTTS
jgi:DNA-binding MarR family transcriptional regulator